MGSTLRGCKKAMFKVKLLHSLISVKLLVTVRVDNVGTIFMAGNVTATSLTKHVDIGYNYVDDYVEENRIS